MCETFLCYGCQSRLMAYLFYKITAPLRLFFYCQQVVQTSNMAARTKMASTPSTRAVGHCKSTATWRQTTVDGRWENARTQARTHPPTYIYTRGFTQAHTCTFSICSIIFCVWSLSSSLCSCTVPSVGVRLSIMFQICLSCGILRLWVPFQYSSSSFPIASPIFI